MKLIPFFIVVLFLFAKNTIAQTYNYTDSKGKSHTFTFTVSLLSIQGDQPAAFNFDYNKKIIYVANYGNHSISVIDTNRFLLMESISVKLNSPVKLTTNKNGSLLYILNCGNSDQSITEITTDLSKTKKQRNISLSMIAPMNMLMSKDDSFFYVADMIGNAIYKVGIKNGNVIKRFETDAGPTPMALSKDEKTLYVANTDRNTIIKINTQTFEQEAEILADGLPYTMILSPDEKTLYLGNRRGNSIIFIDIQSFKTIGEPFCQDINNPRDLAVSRDGQILFVANKDDDSVTLIDTVSRQVIGRPIKTKGEMPLAICLNQKSDNEMDLYVANYNSNTVAKITIAIS